MLSVTLRQLEYAVAVQRYGGMTAAATELNVSQPALSVALGQLEAQLGKSLFLRRAGGPIVATSFGRDFLKGANEVLDSARRLATDQSPTSRSPVTVAVYEDLAPLLLAPVLAALRRAHPQIEVNLFVGGFEDIASALQSGVTADLAITYDLGLDRSFERRELALLPLEAVVHTGHRFASGGKVTMADVASEPIILTNQGLSKSHMLRVFSERGFSLNVAFSAGTMETMRSFAANDLGVGLCYTKPRHGFSYDGLPVRHVTISDADAAEPIALVHHRAEALSGTALIIRDAILGLNFDIGDR